MVSFTQGVRDTNFHPHVRISGGKSTQLFDPHLYTPFATLHNGRSATEFHQQSVHRVFPLTEVCTDMQRMNLHPALGAAVLAATNQAVSGLWYRWVSTTGEVQHQSVKRLRQLELETEVFQFSSQHSGWVVPNRVHMVFDFIYQALSSGRDTIYHLSGPQMVEYIVDHTAALNTLYDAVRQRIPDLPLTLRVRIVPVAAARFVTLRSNASRLRSICEMVSTLQTVKVHEAWYGELSAELPELTLPIESAQCLSQYDLLSADDLAIDHWMLTAPLSEVIDVYNRLERVTRTKAPE